MELGPRSNKAGPCLVLLQQVSATLTEFFEWYSASHIRRYCPRVFWLGHDSQFASNQVSTLSTNGRSGKHCACNFCNASFGVQEDLLSNICSAGAPEGAVRLQCFPRSLEDWLGVSSSVQVLLAANNSIYCQVHSKVEKVPINMLRLCCN